jgi:hypothetical protein
VSEALRVAADPLPPLDKGFFSRLAQTQPRELKPISDYMKEKYGVDVLSPAEDGLEAVMAVVYTDIRHGELGPAAEAPFRSIIRAVNAELTTSTNQLKPDLDSHLARIVRKQVDLGTSLNEIAFVTYNYDLQIEKSLLALEKAGITTTHATTLNFPYCYHLPEPVAISRPPDSATIFPKGNSELLHVPVFKLHGSLNWYSAHGSRNPSINSLLRTNRIVRVTPRMYPTASMTFTRARKTYAFPVVIPPVINKSAILPAVFGKVWKDAESQLKDSEHVIVFGYSCPIFDHESANLMTRCLRSNDTLDHLTIIDPNAAVIERYADLSHAQHIDYYRDVETYLT